jgi:predicted deacetylase
MVLEKVVRDVEDNTVILSVHDVSPIHEDDIVETYDLLADLGISSMTLLAVPFYGLKKSNKFTDTNLFTKFLRSLDLEISMHGYSHVSKSGSPNELSGLTKEKVISRLKDGASLLRRSFGAMPSGFVPPLWDSAPKIVSAVKQIGLDYCVNGDNIIDNSKNKVFKTANRIVSQGKKSLSFEDSMIEIELGGSMQIGIHPLDYRMNSLYELLEDLKDRLGYRFVGFKDYLESVK